MVEFAVGEQSPIGRDLAAMEFQLEAAVESEPKSRVLRFTRWVFHARNPS
jgi:hypothetical protein